MDLFWEKQAWEKQDKHLVGLKQMPFQRVMPPAPRGPGMTLVRGPRQIGKSSWLKTLLSQWVREGRRCYYLSCETVSGYRELAEILRSLSSHDAILLDEVTFVDEWWRAVKSFMDSSLHHTLVLTGSHALDLRKGIDLMPGRWGNGGEIELLPMSFDEFESARRSAGWHTDDRVRELEIYFRVGGFPAAVAEAGPLGNAPTRAMATYLQWLRGDLLKEGKQEQYLKELLGQLALTLTTPLSLQTLAKKTSIGSHHTVQDYIAVLESCFAVRTLRAMDPNDGRLQHKKNKKFYFTDPLLYWIALEWSGLSGPAASINAERLAELVAHEHLARRRERIGYLSTPSGEVDFIRHREWAIEVKWAPVAHNLSKTYLKLEYARKRVWTQANFLEGF